MQFDYDGKLCKYPTHQGTRDSQKIPIKFLMAVDAAVMVVDSAKGIEAQTKKLFEVVKHRGFQSLPL